MKLRSSMRDRRDLAAHCVRPGLFGSQKPVVRCWDDGTDFPTPSEVNRLFLIRKLHRLNTRVGRFVSHRPEFRIDVEAEAACVIEYYPWPGADSQSRA